MAARTMMRTHAKMQIIAGDRIRRGNVPGYILFFRHAVSKY